MGISVRLDLSPRVPIGGTGADRLVLIAAPLGFWRAQRTNAVNIVFSVLPFNVAGKNGECRVDNTNCARGIIEYGNEEIRRSVSLYLRRERISPAVLCRPDILISVCQDFLRSRRRRGQSVVSGVTFGTGIFGRAQWCN
jgi:hypothetical protein